MGSGNYQVTDIADKLGTPHAQVESRAGNWL